MTKVLSWRSNPPLVVSVSQFEAYLQSSLAMSPPFCRKRLRMGLQCSHLRPRKTLHPVAFHVGIQLTQAKEFTATPA